MIDEQTNPWSAFTGPNAAYLFDLYERYQADPDSVDGDVRAFFDRWGAPPLSPNGAGPHARPAPAAVSSHSADVVAGARAYATAIRAYGHRSARLDPLGGEPPGDAALHPELHGIREDDLASLPASIIGGPLAERAGNALSAVRYLRKVYEGHTGYEFEHLTDAGERGWLREAVESGRFRPPRDPINEREILERLTQVGGFERFLHLAFPSATRFSLEGLGMLVPMLDEIIGAAAEAGTRCVLLGMAHRGRLNVLAHTLGKSYEQIIGEFMGRYRRTSLPPVGGSGEGWTGDVKYHLGARRAVRGGREVEMSVIMVPNPSHLEWVNPVVIGMDRAADERRDAPGPAWQDELASMSVLIHGDAAFPGQGVVAETLNLSRLPGYRIGGCIHVIANNQLGFTTAPEQGRSTLYASDLAKGFEIPVIHVNADAPEACLAAARLAHAYRERFHKDVLLDLIGYRRHGHNEGDEPTFTQPKMYAVIKDHPTVREIWARETVRRGVTKEGEPEQMLQEFMDQLHEIRRSLMAQGDGAAGDSVITAGLEAGGVRGGVGRPGVAAEVETAVPLEDLEQYNQAVYAVPEGFNLHPKLERPFARRRAIFSSQAEEEGDAKVEWAHAEGLAFASILADGTPIRFTGQDVGRGTFSHRHLALHDSVTGACRIPLQSFPFARASFDIWNSPLSEAAVLGFEFGYSVQAPEALVLWEAQYGDFVNVPQVIIDQFLVSARSKWEQYSGMVMLLPHGYEGQGPEHSSARLERFLQLAAEDNLRIANCTTSAQYFHILRRQAKLLSLDPRPLILLSPKSLLRHPGAASPPEEFTRGRFQPVLDHLDGSKHRETVRRLVFCSGKVFYDFEAAREKTEDGAPWVAAARIEELYPFPVQDVVRVVDAYPNLREVVWMQEEPRNMGAWTYVAPRLRDILAGELPLLYVGRTRRASPAEGSHDWHVRDQTRLVSAALAETPQESEQEPPGDGSPEAEALVTDTEPEVEHAR